MRVAGDDLRGFALHRRTGRTRAAVAVRVVAAVDAGGAAVVGGDDVGQARAAARRRAQEDRWAVVGVSGAHARGVRRADRDGARVGGEAVVGDELVAVAR